ncbi:hypothetical protein CK203_102738 [Vitis vinifera]|uniref:Uncharacterized protein n=1 Tax=Vitis vinifera TaxID=29760 RepID=A0A438C695_VITVI|nr:hypothetical protein CK203_102738 [Vitis vinifera]
METKVKDMSLQMVNSVGVGRFLNWALVDARGVAEGLLLFWDNSLGEVRGGKRGYSISIRFRNCADGFTWIFSGVYGLVIGFKDLVRSWWNDYSVEGYISHCIAEKLKALKKDLKNWNREVVGNVSFNRVETFSRLQCWEAKENENPLTPRKAETKKLALEYYKKWALLEETSLETEVKRNLVKRR